MRLRPALLVVAAALAAAAAACARTAAALSSDTPEGAAASDASAAILATCPAFLAANARNHTREFVASRAGTGVWQWDYLLTEAARARHKLAAAEFAGCRHVLEVGAHPRLDVAAFVSAWPRAPPPLSVTVVSPMAEPACGPRALGGRPGGVYRAARSLLEETLDPAGLEYDCVLALGLDCWNADFERALSDAVANADVAVLGTSVAHAEHGGDCLQRIVAHSRRQGRPVRRYTLGLHLSGGRALATPPPPASPPGAGAGAQQQPPPPREHPHHRRGIWVLSRPGPRTCALANVTYVASDLEREWAALAPRVISNATYCSAAAGFGPQFDAWLAAAGDATLRRPPPPPNATAALVLEPLSASSSSVPQPQPPRGGLAPSRPLDSSVLSHFVYSYDCPWAAAAASDAAGAGAAANTNTTEAPQAPADGRRHRRRTAAAASPAPPEPLPPQPPTRFQLAVPIEPLAGHLRHPRAWCVGGDSLVVRYEFLIPASAAAPPALLAPRRLLLDLGARTYAEGLGRRRPPPPPGGSAAGGAAGASAAAAAAGAAGGAANSGTDEPLTGQQWLVESFAARGVAFDRIVAWDAKPAHPSAIFGPLPGGLLPVYQYVNVPASADPSSPANPWRVLRALASPADFVVVKLDIDSPGVEEALLGQLLGDRSLQALIDELFFEVNPLEAGWSSIAEGHETLGKLRAAGVRAHGWI